MINITVENKDGDIQIIEIPEGINLNLMETLKAYEYNIRATCGGMALCSDCHCQVQDGWEKLSGAQEQELITLDSRPDATDSSRLACQIKISPEINGLSIKLIGEGD
ncbi:2Fe-2S iron-sulfur cluster-binding protein [Pedobacter sp. P351]|uniref:2Fe-2S iron-sulfur cluster-binding protein n=1 Tax=Pedobacter superstes TaxID=3133441 RepID=UPI00309B3B71